jgi:hypothetical protein
MRCASRTFHGLGRPGLGRRYGPPPIGRHARKEQPETLSDGDRGTADRGTAQITEDDTDDRHASREPGTQLTRRMACTPRDQHRCRDSGHTQDGRHEAINAGFFRDVDAQGQSNREDHCCAHHAHHQPQTSHQAGQQYAARFCYGPAHWAAPLESDNALQLIVDNVVWCRHEHAADAGRRVPIDGARLRRVGGGGRLGRRRQVDLTRFRGQSRYAATPVAARCCFS